jgi:hypothetical protein
MVTRTQVLGLELSFEVLRDAFHIVVAVVAHGQVVVVGQQPHQSVGASYGGVTRAR